MAGMWAFAVASIFCLMCVLVEGKYMVYNTSSGIDPRKLNVHLVPHTHDDVGWLKTVDQYYVGSNNSIQGACVQNVLDSLIPALLADENRRFIYVEQAFFQRWWRQQSEAVKRTVRKLVSSGQLELINGGMCMHDEAAPHYIDMIDQTTLGHRYIKEQFDVTPRTGWQIDPFGHSAVQAYLLGAEVGFDSLFFGRIDYQDRAKRRDEKKLEVIWQGSKTRGSSSQIFAGAFYAGNYEPPTGFYFEINDDSPVVQDDMDLFDYNVHDRVNDFVAAALSQANVTRSNHIMWTMGTDFKYQYAETWFRNMDKLIHYVNLDGRVNAFYSTPSFYTDAKHALNESWPLKSDDYFPYADRINAYWTGYFTSRPATKRYVRVMSGYYLAARQLEYFLGRSKSGPTTDSLADALAIAQHHDAVSGTEKQHVADDYAKRLFIGYKESESVVATSLGCLIQSSSSSKCKSPATNFKQCPLLNISYCPPTEVDLSPGKKLVVLVYNSLGWKRSDVVRIPVINENVQVKDSSGKLVPSQILPIVNASMANRKFYASAHMGESPSTTPTYWLAFKADVPPLGFSTYVISTATSAGSSLIEPTIYTFDGSQNENIEIGPGDLKLIYSGHDGKLMQYINSKSTVNNSLEQSYSYYTADDGSKDSPKDLQASGAYIFRPNATYQVQPSGKTPLTVFRGPLFDEVHQKISSWIYQITRVYKEKEHVELEFTVGPIPVDDGFGKEVVTQLKTQIGSNKTFYTDSNGRDFLERIRDYRADWDLQVNQPVAGNYYPINLGIYIKDESTELSVLVDRSVGGSSINDGEVEIMLHRRLLHDDGRGVAEALNETVCVQNKCSGLTVQGKYYLRLDPLGDGAKWRRSFGQEIYSPFLLAFTEQDDSWTNFPVPTFTAMDPSYSLPDNVAILTLEELADGSVLFRLAHLYEEGEDKDLSALATVDLKKVFPNKVRKIKEMSLSANQEREEMERKRLSWKVEGLSTKPKADIRGGLVDSDLVVELGPMEIRTFIIHFDSKDVLKADR
ncbi:probable alpha-mannosidase At5g13980 [Andrographis paniculata]|uniref:probable alpha-mannosidase At5g13980 n=1 Tax=Andrographis paniculata TaxID=175694 RepID=UPI0021E8907D|nr:probable alpha-mannosidase At5g13980 [Andrographis paniculata]